MKKKIYYIMLGILPTLWACQADEQQMPASDAAATVTLRTDIGALQTRTPYELTTPSSEKPLDATVWASTTAGTFANGSADGSDGTTVSKHVDAHFISGTSTLTGVKYPHTVEGVVVNKPTVYFIGLYPKTWSTPAGTSATHTVTGRDDLLYAPQVTGEYATATPPTLHFYHLLTWLRFKVVADDAEVRDAWGKLKSIQLNAQPTSVSLDLSAAPIDPKNTNVYDKLTFTGSSPMSLYGTGTNTTFPAADYTLPTTPTEVAYVLCRPVVATNALNSYEYTLTLSTEHRSNVTVNIDLKDAVDAFYSGNTIGQQFEVTLRFTMGKTLAVATQVTGWQFKGYGDAEVNE